MTKSIDLDRFDRALLDLVRRDNLTPARKLAEIVGLSESAVLRRLRELRRTGVIVADVAVVSAEALGQALTMHVLVRMEREGTAVLDGFVRSLRRRPEVRAAWYVTGVSDFMLQVRVPDMAAYERFTREALNDDPNVRSFKTLVSIRQVVDDETAAPAPLAR